MEQYPKEAELIVGTHITVKFSFKSGVKRIRTDLHRTILVCPVEVGCRGFYYETLPRVFNFLNIPRTKKKRALNKAAVVSLKGSYTIWLSRYNKTWSDNWQLAERPGTV